MRMLLGLLVLAACGGDDGGSDPHEVTDCAPGIWGVTKRCELACAMGATGGVDNTGDGFDDTCGYGLGPMPCNVASVTSFDGERGCCARDTGRDIITLFPCKPL